MVQRYKIYIELKNFPPDLSGEPEDACAWQKKQLVFRDASLGKVIRSLEKNYGVEIAVKMDTIEPFTGTLPNNNLTEALQIVSEAYQVKFSKTPAGKYVLR